MAQPSTNLPSENDPQKSSRTLSPNLTMRVKVIKDLLDEVYTKSLDEWLVDFELDQNAEREIATWESMAFTYTAFVEGRSHLPIEAKQEVLQVTLASSLGRTEKHLLSRQFEHLAEQDIREICSHFRSAVESIYGLQKVGDLD